MEKLDRNPVFPRIFQSLIHIQLHQLPILLLSSAFVFPAEFFRTFISPGDNLLNALGPVLRERVECRHLMRNFGSCFVFVGGEVVLGNLSFL